MTGVAILLLGAAVAFAFARWLDAPPVPFLVLAGIALARFAVFPVELLQDAVVLGLTFVLFVAGTELNPARVRGQQITALQVGLGQFFVLGLLGTTAAVLLRFALLPALYIGLALAASSTLVIVRLLQRRRQLFEPFGRLVVGVLLLQDILVILTIPLLTFAPAGINGVARGLAGTLALVGLAYVCLRWLSPRLAALRKEPEPLLLAALALLSVFITLALLLDLPLAAGAFLAGVALSPFPVRGIIRGQLTSINDFFSALFFIALGGLILPPSLRVLGQALVFTLLLLIVTPPLVAAMTQRAGFTTRAGIESGLLLGQTSELSLVLALQGLVARQLSQDTFTTLVIVTVVTMVMTPTLSSERVVQWLMRMLPGRRRPDAGDVPEGHVLLLGCGSGGMPLLETLFAAGHRVVAIDDDPRIVARLRDGDVEVLRGDASDPATLRAAGADRALIISSTIRRPRDNERLLATCGDVPVLVRVFEDEDADWVRSQGGTPIVYSDAAAEEFIRWFEEFVERRQADRPATEHPQPLAE